MPLSILSNLENLKKFSYRFRQKYSFDAKIGHFRTKITVFYSKMSLFQLKNEAFEFIKMFAQVVRYLSNLRK